jgi:hypothetical protein
MQQVSVLETNIGSSTTGNSSNTQVIFNDNGTLRGDAGLVYNATTDTLTVGAATITGALTVGTGANSAVQKAAILGGYTVFENSAGTGNPSITFNNDLDTGIRNPAANTLVFDAGGFEQYRIAALGVFTWSDGAGGTRMTLNSTGLGVGVTPGYKLDVRTVPATAAIEGSRISDATRTMISGQTGATYSYLGIGANQNVIYTSAARLDIVADNQSLFLRTGTNNYLQLDNAGNVGIGVTPSAWASAWKANEIQRAGNAFISNAVNSMGLTSNAYLDSVGWKYGATGTANFLAVGNGNGSLAFYTAASGTGGTAITDFGSPKMQVDANGNLILSSSATPPTLTTNGQLTVNATSNTNVRFSYRGSDGVTRVGNLALS